MGFPGLLSLYLLVTYLLTPLTNLEMIYSPFDWASSLRTLGFTRLSGGDQLATVGILLFWFLGSIGIEHAPIPQLLPVLLAFHHLALEIHFSPSVPLCSGLG